MPRKATELIVPVRKRLTHAGHTWIGRLAEHGDTEPESHRRVLERGRIHSAGLTAGSAPRSTLVNRTEALGTIRTMTKRHETWLPALRGGSMQSHRRSGI